MAEKFIDYNSCPVCGSAAISFALKAKDHTVSGKEFEIWECGRCTLRFTQHVPDASSISPYYQSEDYISHTETNKGIVNRLYHRVRKRTLLTKRKLIERSLGKKQMQEQGRLLDIGAGTGAFVAHMNQSGWIGVGLEPDQNARKRAADIHDIKLLPVEEINSFGSQAFDAITLWHVLEHVHDLHAYMGRLVEMLKKKGRIIIAVPNYTSYDGQYYGQYWAAYDVPRHLYHFSPGSMRELTSRHGLTVHEVVPMWFDAFYISLLSEKYKTGSSRLPAGFYRGAISNLKTGADKEKCSSLVYVLGE